MGKTKDVIGFLIGTAFVALVLCSYAYTDNTFPEVWGVVIVGFLGLLVVGKVVGAIEGRGGNGPG